MNMQSTTSPSAVSKPYHILFPMSATPSERRNCSDLRVKWIGLHPLDMVDRVMLMAEHSAYARSATSSIDVGLLMKRNGAATTSLNAQATDERCQSLLRSILDERKKDMNEHLLNFGQTTQQHIAVSQCPCAHESIRNMMRGPSVAQVNRAPKPSSAKEKNYIYQAMMSNWIFQNWTNPFPDPIQLENLATHLILAQCIVVNANEAQVFNGKSFEECRRCMMNIATKKIETWLVNARLRKWKKSIEYAFDLRRPAWLLLEDSRRLCEGKALRPIEGWNPDEIFASHARYSLPLKAWKRKKKVIKKRSATCYGEATPKRQRVASPKELSAGHGLIELAKGLKVMSTCERKASPSDVVVKVGGMGLSPMNFNSGVSFALEDDARRKMKKGTFFGTPSFESCSD